MELAQGLDLNQSAPRSCRIKTEPHFFASSPGQVGWPENTDPWSVDHPSEPGPRTTSRTGPRTSPPAPTDPLKNNIEIVKNLNLT